MTYSNSQTVAYPAGTTITIIGTWSGSIGANESVILVGNVEVDLILKEVVINVSSTSDTCALELN